jgi:uncharacterized protein YgiM (DUF1202 family)
MRHRILLIFALLAAIIGAAPGFSQSAAALSCGPCPATTTDDLNLRAGPSLSADVLLVIPAGATVSYDNFTGEENGYLSVTYNGVDGFAHSDYLLLFPAFATTTDWLNLRSAASLDAPVLDVMPPGSAVQVLGSAQNGYYSVSFEQRVTGFAHGDYLAFSGQGNYVDGDRVLVRTDALNLRSSAGLGAAVEAILYNGTQVTVTGGPVARDGYTWYRVDAGAIGQGWVAGEYLNIV